MAQASAIEWTDATWNPTVGCTRVSEGCRNCYAFQLHDQRHAAHRAGKKVPDQYAKPFKELQVLEGRLDDPLHWRRPRRVFVNSMSDLFHKDVPDEFIDRVFGTMGACDDRGLGHVFQVLTKRPERMRDYMRARGHRAWNARRLGTEAYPPRNVWLGVSAEDQTAADERIPPLIGTPAAVRFLSCEPLLGPVDLAEVPVGMAGPLRPGAAPGAGPRIDWVIAGGESGPGARPCRVAWLRSIVAQCKAASVPCFVKQLGGHPEGDAFPEGERTADGKTVLHVRQVLTIRDKKGGDPAEWPEDLRVRDFPDANRHGARLGGEQQQEA